MTTLKQIAKGKGERAEQAREMIQINKENTCCICKKKYEGHGNNALPLKKGRCCDECNHDVIEARILISLEKNK